MSETETEIFENTKVVLSVRIHAYQKMKYAVKAQALGITLSDYIESRLINADDEVNPQEVENLKKEIVKLEQQVRTLTSQTSILRDPQLVKLFEQLKGKPDEIETTEGKKLPITYNSVIDVLTAMIYTVKLNQ